MHELACIASIVLALCGPAADDVTAARTGGGVMFPHPTRYVAQEPVPVQATDAWLGSDKFQHFALSWAVTTYAFAAARAAGMDRDASLALALPVAAVVGVGKEVHDVRRGGLFSMRDLAADALGIAAAFFLLREVR